MAPQRSTPYQHSHALTYAVRVTQRDPNNASTVLACECLFCVYFGREAKVGSKRKSTTNTKYFTKPFRTDNYKQHHETQHPEHWKLYQAATDEEKKAFFEGTTPIKKALHGHFSTSQVFKRFLTNASIVNEIIGDMLWDPEDIEGETHGRMMSSFEDSTENGNEMEDEDGVDKMCVVIKNPMQFALAIDYLRFGCSFQQAARVMGSTKERTGLACIGCCSDYTIAKYAHFACAVNLQKISELLSSSWTFAIAMDMSTHRSTSYLDIRIRLHHMDKGIINLHLLAIPVFERHTGEIIFEIACKALNVLKPGWKDVIIGIATDGKKKMTGCISGVATRFQDVAKPNFIHIWCGAHQLDLCLQDAYIHFGSDEFYNQLTSIISYLHRQQNLISDMRTKCPKVSDMRWESMSQVSTWFKLHKVLVDEYLELKNPACVPLPVWWAQIMIVDHFSSRARITFKEIQGHTVTVSMQQSRLAALQEFYLQYINAKGPLQNDEAELIDEEEWLLSPCRRFAGKYSKMRAQIMNFGTFISEKLEQVDESELDILVKDATKLYLHSAIAIGEIVAERNSQNNAGEELPPAFPQQLALLEHSDFCEIVRKHRERLIVNWSRTEIDIIEQEHQELLETISREPQFVAALNSCDDKTSFDQAWHVVKGRFKTLLRFCGGLACVFPGTAQVESDFSVVKAEKDTFCNALTDLSLEGVLHSKQFDMLEAL